ncbi:hypothetical protein K505DRAFT_90247 [Melanomma pulvis-pyrius CBS 109.77]|uniref:DUF2293 domain-containing protein n=1 Tax=Melanomma pulvis-pyrius CBS 109.77 TaxID=1314802 RepID=A0A6A6XRP3_9PLEO|nr:hypothetical protein K505DRAFT_90247 [Melanomma pulvis-pyrius CBS 109.77]
MPRREITVHSKTPMPEGYAFLRKGIPYKTLHCRRLTHEAGKQLYVVEDNKKILGIRVPKSIFFNVQSAAKETLPSRRLATEKRDTAVIRGAAAELSKQFPAIPEGEREAVLTHGFRKYSGRVGRTAQIPLSRKAQLAVIAHIRHQHTKYDQLLEDGMDRDAARRIVQSKIQNMLRDWGSKEDFSWYFHNEDDSSE